MRKILILIFAIVLISVTYNFYTNKKTISTNNDEQKNISLRVEDSNIIEDDQTPVNNEEEFTTYINEVDQEIDEVLNKETLTENDESTLRNTFITLTDFIFYNGTIKGKTFNDLTTSAKEKVISVYEKIDSKIEAKFPGYKEKIKDSSTKTYNNIKEQLTTLKNNLLDSYKQEIGEDNYTEQQELLDESINTMKDSFSPVIDTIVDKSKELYETAKDKTSSWYQEWKEGVSE